MRCPKCSSSETAVTDSREKKRAGGIVYRRRRCKKCYHRFSTYEVYDIDVITPKVAEQLRMVNKLLKRCLKWTE